ncbi:RNA polymerase factor sigma-54 [Leptothrix ochracea]|uniref:RNA polymerase factor sigma-54 n=2 Tax=Leptothrix ochracea TaxID=735331 RepID=UPI0034E2AA71
MRASLQVRLSQHLALTPQLQQSIRLLQLSTLELQQEVEQMLEQNPFLDVEEDHALPSLEASALPERVDPRDNAQERARDEGAEADTPRLDQLDQGVTARDDWENGTEQDDFDGIADLPSLRQAGSGTDEDADDWRERTAASASLADHLRVQVADLRLSAEEAFLVEALIESLSDDGYLADPLDEIHARLWEGLLLQDATAALSFEDAQALREDLMDQLRCALHWLQSLEPTGVGARDLSECLQLQLRQHVPSPERDLALQICAAHLDLLARRDVTRLLALTGADAGALRLAQQLIKSLEPKPGRPFSTAEANIIVPDVIVQKAGRGWRVMLNPDVMPRLRINEMYAQALRQQRGQQRSNVAAGGTAAGDDSGNVLATRLQEARWFVKNIIQRFDTIERVSRAIVERQKAFFSHGEIAMKPLVLREIADELGLHESTISRVTTAKYMTTPYGTFELKYFFGSSLNTETGGNASSTAVRALIKQLVSAESPHKPLSDSHLSDMLAEQGIQVARRTVAKYRESLRIPPANLRKAM